MKYRNYLLVLACFGFLFAHNNANAGDDVRAVTVTLTSTDAFYGQEMIYKITVENTGNVAYSGRLAIEFHSALGYVSSLPRTADVTDNVATWNIDDLAVGYDDTFSLKLSVPGNGQITFGPSICATAKADVDPRLPAETVAAATDKLCHPVVDPD